MSKTSQPMILPGLKPVLELLRDNPAQISKILCVQNRYEQLADMAIKKCVPLEEAPASKLDTLCSTPGRAPVAHQGVLALLASLPEQTLKEFLENLPKAPLPLALALDEAQDTGNVGSLARAAFSLGCAGLILPKHNSARLGPTALRSSAGALARLSVVITINLARALDEAEEAGIPSYGSGAAQDASKMLNAFDFNWPLPAILVLGNENKGIRPGVAKRCSCFITIPFKRAFDSLSISQAGAMLMALCASSFSTSSR